MLPKPYSRIYSSNLELNLSRNILFDSNINQLVDNGQRVEPRNDQKLENERIDQFHQQQMQHLIDQKREMQQKMFSEPQFSQVNLSRNSVSSSRSQISPNNTTHQRSNSRYKWNGDLYVPKERPIDYNKQLNTSQPALNLQPQQQQQQQHASRYKWKGDLYVPKDRLNDSSQQLNKSQQNLYLQNHQIMASQQNDQSANQLMSQQSTENTNRGVKYSDISRESDSSVTRQSKLFQMLQEQLQDNRGIDERRPSNKNTISGPPSDNNIISSPPANNINISGPPANSIPSGAPAYSTERIPVSSPLPPNNINISGPPANSIPSGAPAYLTERIPVLGTVNNYNLKNDPIHNTSYQQVIYVYVNGKMEKNFRTVSSF